MGKLFREHRHFFLIIPALIIVMTWPTFYHVLETDTFWVPGSGEDVWFELWEGWYGAQILQGKADLFYTNLLYYPQGVSLAYHQYTLPHMLMYNVLRALLPVSNAYNLAFLLTLFANALATYVCANYFIKDKWISLFAAAVVGISVALRIKSDAQFWTYYTIPLSIYFMHRAVVEYRWSFAAPLRRRRGDHSLHRLLRARLSCHIGWHLRLVSGLVTLAGPALLGGGCLRRHHLRRYQPAAPGADVGRWRAS